MCDAKGYNIIDGKYEQCKICKGRGEIEIYNKDEKDRKI